MDKPASPPNLHFSGNMQNLFSRIWLPYLIIGKSVKFVFTLYGYGSLLDKLLCVCEDNILISWRRMAGIEL